MTSDDSDDSSKTNGNAWEQGKGDETERNKLRSQRIRSLGKKLFDSFCKNPIKILSYAVAGIIGLSISLVFSFQIVPAVVQLSLVGVLLSKMSGLAVFNPRIWALFAVVLVRFLAVVLQAFYFRYPSFKRRFAGVLSLSIEIALIWNIWIDLQTYNVQAILISLIVFSVFLTIGEFWILTSKESLARAEERLLKAYGINTVVEHCPHSGMSYFKVKSDSSRILVLTHGYFGGKCSFAPIIKELSKNYTIYCVDWIGMGSSSRLFWWVMANDSNQVENAYLVAFDKWRKFQGIEKFDLLGHSFGGYLVGLYAIKYPEYVENLILASPLGIPPLNGIPEDSKSMFPGFLSVLWNLRITPHFIIKLIGPFAEKIFESGARRRFGEDLDHIEEFSDYIFHINAAPISGEIGLSVMFYIGAYAKRPLGRRILDSEIASKLNRIIFLYGSYDWMDSKTGSLLSQQICQQYSPTKSSTIILEDCGHQMFLESRHAIKFCKAINSLF